MTDETTQDTQDTPRTVSEILADYRAIIADYRDWGAWAVAEGGDDIWRAVMGIDREDLARVLDAIAVVTLPPLLTDEGEGLTPAARIAALESWLTAIRPRPVWERVSVPAGDLEALVRGELRSLREQQRLDADRVRVQRGLTYEGPRDRVEAQLLRSLHGQQDYGNGVVVTAVTVDLAPVAVPAALPTLGSDDDARDR